MFIRDFLFRVSFSSYAENHFCKDFWKKYKKKWLSTRETIKVSLERSCAFQRTSLLDILSFSAEEDQGIGKFDFRIAGTSQSSKSSGNRVVFFICNKSQKIEILLVYGKDACPKNKSETQWIFECIKENFPEYKKLCR